jgi:hypothetical protein
LSQNRIGNDGAISLAENYVWRHLSVLDLSHNKIGDKGAIGLALNSSWKELTELDLQSNLIDDESSIFALGRNSAWKRLEKLLVNGNSGVTPTRKLLFSLNSKISNEFNKELEERKGKDIKALIDEKEAQFKAELEKILSGCKDERREALVKFCNER